MGPSGLIIEFRLFPIPHFLFDSINIFLSFHDLYQLFQLAMIEPDSTASCAVVNLNAVIGNLVSV